LSVDTRRFASGTYFLRAASNGSARVRRVTLLR
jgi:hypothetical protein